ncbi:chemotaxis protein CheW [Natrarchaeobaculum aegyptiacum]|uniref:Chemotaxis protein CheW n=1 Tax=Natrarchaeobaculum aegyptiacum TaxID=745377 RepID=A0A2Z2HUS6_9EURY|nr:chemotaxis protein CheW [Natrarchaeobaculum aegyptiacum]ARS88774.1 chemotaxis protein CheW [Natrarchaeobaculum aegyptiacum]
MATTNPNQTATASTHVLEFDLGDNRYCVDIGYIAEIVNTDELTPIPNTPPHIEGVMDLRGETTKIVNLRKIFDDQTDREELGDRIVVFKRRRDSSERIGWLADEVHQVRELQTDLVDTSVEGSQIAGIVRRDDRFVLWIDPTAVRV